MPRRFLLRVPSVLRAHLMLRAPSVLPGLSILLAVIAASIVLPLSLAPTADATETTSAPKCTQTATTTTTTPAGSVLPATAPPAEPASGEPCWVDVEPYPFGSEGSPVQTPAQTCGRVFKGEAPAGSQCALTVTSLAFRAWNRGLAATDTSEALSKNPFGVWLYNGSSWIPSPGFPGYGTCPGHTVLWAGKLDYWLIGGPSDTDWSRLCRFDGSALEWESFELPEATKKRVTVAEPDGKEVRRPGGIAAGACLAWNNCWFFGTYGVVLHWSPHSLGGRQVLSLSDASPDPSQLALLGEYTAAVARPDLRGNVFGVAVGATAELYNESPSQVLPAYEGGAPPELWASSGGPFSPVPFAPPTSPQENDPYRTDLVAVDFDSAGAGWVAGNPAGLQASSYGFEARPASPKLPPPPSPLVAVSSVGASTTCAGPPADRFTYTPPAFQAPEPPDSFLWSSIATVPGSDEALAGGRLVPKNAGTAAGGASGDPNTKPEGEPVIVKAACDGTTSVTRFQVEDPTYKGSPKPLVAADREGDVTTIAANAANDAWAATLPGSLAEESGVGSEPQPPHLYRLTDGLTPQAPAGDDLEERPLELQLDAPVVVLEPPPPAPAEPAPTTIVKKRRVKLLPAIYDIKAKLHYGPPSRHGLHSPNGSRSPHGPHSPNGPSGSPSSGLPSLSLYLTFRIRRPIVLGAQALRHGHVVSEARARRFAGKRGLLILPLDRKRWPTKVRFVP